MSDTVITITLSPQQIDAIGAAMEIAADDQENYCESGNPAMDYQAEDLRDNKAVCIRAIAGAAGVLGLLTLQQRFENLADEFRMIADSMADDGKIHYCQGCGREETACSVSPCESVIADREAEL